MPLPLVLVTGASGFVGANVVATLLASKEYRVRGTVRDPSNAQKTAGLTALPGAKERLTLVKADLMDDAKSWDDTLSKCDYVMHTASPFVLKVEDKQRDLIDPAVIGTTNVLSAVARSKTIKRTILTSSIAAIMCNKWDKEEAGYTFSEKDWSSPSMEYDAYYLSKKLAEEKAWELAKEHKFDLISINPTFVMGPIVQKTSSQSITFVKDMCAGKFKGGAIDDRQAYVDVRDVARAHYLALTNGVVGERYLCSNGCGEGYDYVHVGKQIVKNFPEYESLVPRRNFGKVIMYLVGPLFGISWHQNYNNINLPFNYTTKKIEKDLKISWTPLETSMKDMVESLKEANELQ